MSRLDDLLTDIFGNIVGNKLTDVEKEQLLYRAIAMLCDIKDQLNRIERKIERNHNGYYS